MIPISRNRFIGILVAICQLVLVTIAMPAKALESLGASEDTADIVVGCLYPMSGRAGVLGRDSVVGIRLALQYIEQQELPALPRLRVLLGDTKSKRSTAVSIFPRHERHPPINDSRSAVYQGLLC